MKVVLKKELTAIKIINNRPYLVSRMRGGPFYTVGQFAELCGIPRNVAQDWVTRHKLLKPKYLKALAERERPQGFVQKTGKEVSTTREIVISEIQKIGNEFFKNKIPLDDDEVRRIAVENCQKQHPSWTMKYIEACLYYIHDDGLKSVRGKPERPSIRLRKERQRRRYITPYFK